jgi:shikimate dehydrogenase
MSLSPHDVSYGVMGWPVKHSLSPELHNYWLAQQRIDEQYGLLEIEPKDLREKTEKLVAAGLKGWNVTVPHKINMMLLCDEISQTAKIIGAVNTVKIVDDRLFGTNTDAYGFIQNLINKVPTWNSQKAALVIGAGGAARAAVYSLCEAGVPKIYIANRTYQKAYELCADFGYNNMTALEWEDRESVIADVSLIVNTTTLGMTGLSELEFDLSTAKKDTVVYDIVYKPLMTKLLKEAEKYGLNVVTGFGMLVHQAAAAFELWFNVSPDLSGGFIDELEERFK